MPSDGKDEDTPLVQDGRKRCLFECHGDDKYESGRCCNVTAVVDGKTRTIRTEDIRRRSTSLSSSRLPHRLNRVYKANAQRSADVELDCMGNSKECE